MKQTLIDIVMPIVDSPEEISVTEKVSGDTCILELKVAKDDMGKVIGRQGKVAKSIRMLMCAAAARQQKKVIVDIIK